MEPSVKYDPRKDGARCDECPLGPKGCLREGFWNPVKSEYHTDAAGRPKDLVAVVVSPPKTHEEDHGVLLSDQRSGGEWMDAVTTVDRHRTDFALIPVMSCAPPGQPSGAWDRMTKKLDRINKARSREGLSQHPHPADCCRPRLRKEVSRFKNIICLGKRAMHAVTGDSRAIRSARGDFIEFTADWQRLYRDPETQNLMLSRQPRTEQDVGHRVFPTLEPGYVAVSPGWRHYWHVDLGKALRWFEDRLHWIEPKLLLYPTPAQLRAWFDVPSPFWVVDVETDGIIALETYLRCVGFATPDLDTNGRPVVPGEGHEMVARSVGIDILSGDGVTRHMDPDNEAEILDILRWMLSNKDMLKVGHNAGYFDKLVLSRLGHPDGPKVNYPRKPLLPWLDLPDTECPIEPVLDTLFLSRAWKPEVPKGLKTVGTVLTDIGHWESTEGGESGAVTENDKDRLLYNTRGDTVVNARITPPLTKIASERGYFRKITLGDRTKRPL